MMVRARCSLAVLCVLAVGLFVGFVPSSAWAQSCGSGNIDDEQFQQVSAGGDHTCALGDNNLLLCWGANDHGQSDSPTDATFISVAVGKSHSCAVDADGDLRCWGANDNGQAPSFVQGPFAKVAAGAYHTCATDDAGQATCWGLTNYGQANAAGGSYLELALGTWVSCGRDYQGQVQCWGAENLALLPKKGPFNQIALGGIAGCVIDGDSDLECWGSGGISGPPEGSWREVAVGGRHACAVNYDDNILCWGSDSSGQADPNGDGVIADSTDPEGTKYTQISAGSAHTCGIEQGSGNISCWGSNTNGQLAPEEGSGSTARESRRSEQCEYGVETSSCNDDCGASSCGDNTLNTSAGEVCDDGNTTSGDACNSTCTSDESCGNGILDPGEACDDGNTVDDVTCKGDCSLSDDCGDGVVQAGEECDEYGVNTSACDWNCTLPSCGDGIVNEAVEPAEQCDDLDQTQAPVDSPNCNSDCTLSVCGDNHENRLAGEQCDEGGVNTSGCNSDCTLPKCGDGIVNMEANEVCDDPAAQHGFGTCLSDCSAPYVAVCGNHFPDVGEECDQGPDGTASCTADCRKTWTGKSKKDREVKCVVGVNKAAGTLFGKHVKLQGDCLKAKNWSPSPEACLEGDPKNAILFAGKQVGTAERKQCSAKGRRLYAVPAFGYSGAQNVVDAMPLGVSGGGVLRDIFGEDLSAALASTNKKLAGCQNNVGRASADLLKAKLASYLKCTAKELISDYVGTPERLAECLDWETGGFPHSPKVAKIANKFTKNINKTRTKIGTALEKGNCSIQDLASAFPGECSGATSDTGDFMGCVDKHTDCRLCLMASGVSRLKVDCDFFDDGVTNGTCVADAVTGVGEIGMLKIPDTTMARTALQHIDGGSYAGAFGESVVHTVEEDPTGSMICSGSSECEGVEFNTVAADDLDLDRTANMDHVIWYPAMRNYRLELVYTEYEGASWPATQAVPVYYDNESYWMQEYGGVIHHFNTIKSGNGWVRARIRKVN